MTVLAETMRSNQFQPTFLSTKASRKRASRKCLLLVGSFAILYNVLFTCCPNIGRRLSLNLGNGQCEWQPPNYDIPDNIDFWKTAVVGYPSGDKRLTFVQMEALTGWAAKDEWDFEFLGNSNHPFIKANYPHHEGIWGWGDNADQVVMVVRNMRRALVEYHDILWDIGYAKTWAQAFDLIPNLYQERPPLDDFLAWRDLRVMDEVHWYGWFIDYWMEEGLLRDIFTHKLTNHEHWNMLMQPTVYSRSEQEAAFDLLVGNQDIGYHFDPGCEYNVTGGCRPIKILSAELLVRNETGPAENRKIAKVLTNHEGMAEWVIEEEVWECIWTELIINRKGLKTFLDRDGLTEVDYNFSEEMLEAMLQELDRLIDKYRGDDWSHLEISRHLVALLEMHKALIQQELDEVKSGERILREGDFLGPKERKKRKFKKMVSSRGSITMDEDMFEERLLKESNDYSEYFDALHRHVLLKRKTMIKEEVFENDLRRQRARKLHNATLSSDDPHSEEIF